MPDFWAVFAIWIQSVTIRGKGSKSGRKNRADREKTLYKPKQFGYNSLKSLNGTGSVHEAHSEPRSVQGGGGRYVKITRERNGEPRRAVTAPVTSR
jgi:hypothetical protein